MSPGHLILVVEDNDDLRWLVTRQLKKLGYPTHYATNGAEAVRMLREHKYDLVLMDIMMADMDGITATAEIRTIEKERGTARLPIIAITAFHDKEKCLEAGMDDYMFKPVLLDALGEKMRQWL
jgi:CheY-like chemotaxis protein